MTTAEDVQLVPIGPKFAVDTFGLVPVNGARITMDDFSQAADRLRAVYGSIKFFLGDLINLGESLFAEEASQVIDQSFLSEREVKAYSAVAQAVTPAVRAEAQTWDHCAAVAKLPEPLQLEWLERSSSEGWSAGKLKTELALAGNAKTFLQWMVVVDCGTEAKRDKVAERLEGEGFTVLRRDKVRKQPKPKKAKKGPVTAKGKGKGKMSAHRRAPK